MVRGDAQLAAAKQAYRNAKEEGNRQEEARWANVMGDILKKRGEYVEALKWLRIDYDVSLKYLPQKQLLPSCQSLGELYLLLHDFKDALIYQKKHLELAKDADDLVEQQRAATQLGRTYHELFMNSNDDHYSVRNAKKYFNLAMKLAEMLKENPPNNGSSFVKEYVDAHNNIGMLEMDIDNLEEAKNILTKGLNICDEEEVAENDDTRSRLYHNLGNVYMELRMWDIAKQHIEKDIIICKKIGHCQGEAKGYINLGELHYRVQKYDEAIQCYQRALDLARSMEDEDALVSQIDQNIKVTKEAIKIMDEMKKEEQKLKKLVRNMLSSRGTPHERKCLMQQMTLLNDLIEKSSTISAWLKHLEFSKQKKRIAIELCDKEKVGDSFLALGESYQKLRKFKKAIKWFTKSWETYKAINNLEGQALAKINIGDVLDRCGDWAGASNSFEEAYRVAVEANLSSIQLLALENMHYSEMIRFDNIDEARRLQLKIDNLKEIKKPELATETVARDCCSETDSEDSLLNKSHAASSPELSKSSYTRSKSLNIVEQLSDNEPIISLIRSCKQSAKRTSNVENQNISYVPADATPIRLSKSSDLHAIGRKRVRVVLSDDEGDMDDSVGCAKGRSRGCALEDVATSDELKGKNCAASSPTRFQEFSTVASKCANSSCKPVSNEESTCSYKLNDLEVLTAVGKDFRTSSNEEVAFVSPVVGSGSNCDIRLIGNPTQNYMGAHLKLHCSGHNSQYITFRIDNDLINIEAGSCHDTDIMSLESMKVELACLYYLHLPAERRSNGLLPIIEQMKCSGKVMESLEAFKDHKDNAGSSVIDVSIDGWVQKRLMKLYIDCCEEIKEAPNMRLLKKLYISEVEDEVVASECELQDISVTPLLNALRTHKSVAMLDLSHNLLGNGTMEKLQQLFQSGQKYGDLTLNLHCNRFGPTALFQICECPILFTRLEVLNISGNRLTDSCGSYLSNIVEKCTALYSLNLERCSITSRTIQKIADALNSGSNLAQLNIGYNNPISGNSVINLLAKLSNLRSFDELNLNGIKLNKSLVDSLCQFAKTSGLSQLMVANSGIGTDGALQLTESMLDGSPDSMKIDLSCCGVTPAYAHKLKTGPLLCGIHELNLGGNPFLQEGAHELASLLVNPQCGIKVLFVDKCQLGLTGILKVIWALADNQCLEEIYLGDNVEVNKQHRRRHDLIQKSSLPHPSFKTSESSPNKNNAHVIYQQGLSDMSAEHNQLEVADSEEDTTVVEAATSDFDDACTSLRHKSSLSGIQFIHELSTAISTAKHLRLLDISNNGFSTQVAETLYTAWSSRSEAVSGYKHIKDQIVHFSLESDKCCRVKPCCKKN